MHIENKDLDKFQKGILEPEKIVYILEHTGKCDYCADRLMNIESQELIQAPAYLKDKMIKRTQMLDVKAEVQIKTTSRNVQLFMYGLKTTAAVLGALLLLFSVSQLETTDYMEHVNKTEASANWSSQLYEKSNDVVDIMNQFSNRIINGGLNK